MLTVIFLISSTLPVEVWSQNTQKKAIVLEDATVVQKRKSCKITYIYLNQKDTYSNQLARCRRFWPGANLARPEKIEERRVASTFPEVDVIGSNKSLFTHNKEVKYFIGARIVLPGGNYRWEDGPLVKSTSLSHYSNINEVSDSNRKDRCLALGFEGQWNSLPCDSREGAVCEVCVEPPKDKCELVCACPSKNKPEVKCSSGWSCSKGCFIGKLGHANQTWPCPANRWGLSCRWQCNCASQGDKVVYCDVQGGQCPERKCKDKWNGPACNSTGRCPIVNHGLMCDRPCKCKHNQVCDKDTGDCKTGCEVGNHGKTCSTSNCPDYKYGLNGCERNCHCKSCSRKEGHCYNSKCAPPWKGEYCNETFCDTGKWGTDCKNFCACARGEQCHRDTGKCPDICRTGWYGLTCNKTFCNETSYNLPSCDRRCSCEEEIPCDPYTGKCATKSIVTQHRTCPNPKFYGDQCDLRCKVKHCDVCDRWNKKRCLKCQDGYELTLTHEECIASCKERRKWGYRCDETCTDPNCVHCRREKGSSCLECDRIWVLRDNDTCARECHTTNSWGEDCDYKCSDPKCFRCDKFTGLTCSKCIVGWMLGENGNCVSDPGVYEYRGLNIPEVWPTCIGGPMLVVLLTLIVQCAICHLIHQTFDLKETFSKTDLEFEDNVYLADLAARCRAYSS